MTDKERFEELAYNVGVSLDGEKAIMSSDDYDFLYNYALQQAERVQELEGKLYELSESAYQTQIDFLEINGKKNKLLEQNKRYRQLLEDIVDEGSCLMIDKIIDTILEVDK